MGRRTGPHEHASPRGRRLGPLREFGAQAELGHGRQARASLLGWSVVSADDTHAGRLCAGGLGLLRLSCAGEGVV